MSVPQKALSALVCVVVAFVLGFVARLPALMERLDTRLDNARYELNVTSVPSTGTSAWGGANPLPH